MKKLILPALLSLSISANAQDSEKDNYFYTSFGFDVKNAVQGSAPTNYEKALNWTIVANVVTDNIDFGLGYEKFNEIEYDRKFMQLGYHFKINYIKGTDMKFSINPAIEGSWIGREYDEKTKFNGNIVKTKVSDTWFTPSFNVAFNLDLNKSFAVQLCTNLLHRLDCRDLYNDDKWVLSNSAKLIYKINFK